MIWFQSNTISEQQKQELATSFRAYELLILKTGMIDLLKNMNINPTTQVASNIYVAGNKDELFQYLRAQLQPKFPLTNSLATNTFKERLDDKVVSRILELHKQGKTYRAISLELGISPAVAFKYIKRNEVQTRSEKRINSVDGIN